HHALLDGVSAMKLMRRSLSDDPQDTDLHAPWSIGPRKRAKGKKRSSPLGELANVAGSVAALAPSALTVARAALLEQQLTLPFGAPKTMLNVPIGGARRCAAQSWPIKRVVAVKDAAGVTVNDVVLAMCAGALRAYLIEQQALPDRPLVAMVPVSLRAEDDTSSGGNQVGAILCSLATDLDDPEERLDAIHASMRGNKE